MISLLVNSSQDFRVMINNASDYLNLIYRSYQFGTCPYVEVSQLYNLVLQNPKSSRPLGARRYLKTCRNEEGRCLVQYSDETSPNAFFMHLSVLFFESQVVTMPGDISWETNDFGFNSSMTEMNVSVTYWDQFISHTLRKVNTKVDSGRSSSSQASSSISQSNSNVSGKKDSIGKSRNVRNYSSYIDRDSANNVRYWFPSLEEFIIGRLWNSNELK
jgi:hypothetical protein